MFPSRRHILACASLALLWAIASQPAASDATAEHQITHLLKSTFERPTAPLSVEPIVVLGDHAIAGWSQDGRGGRALMRRVKGEWTVHLCSGDSLKQSAVLKDTGIPEADAEKLANALAMADGQLPADKVALFGTFEGTVVIGGDGHHPQSHGAHPQQHK